MRDWQCTREWAPEVYFVLLQVTYTDGGDEHYFLPLALCSKSDAKTAEPVEVIANVSAPEGEFVIQDALAHDAACELLLSGIAAQKEWSTRSGRLRALRTSEFATLRGPPDLPAPIARSAIEQSNTNIRYGDRLLLKLFRRCESGPNPDFEIIRFLTEKTGFKQIPRLGGAWLYQSSSGQEATFAMLQGWVPNSGNAFEEASQYLSRAFESDSGEANSLEESAEYWPRAELLGRRTADLHVALASKSDDPVFAPEPLTPEDLEQLASQTGDHAAELLPQLQQRLADFPTRVRQRVADVQAAQLHLQPLLTVPPLASSITKVRCHSDYHLGQLLCTAGDYVVLDFEGEPARPLAERRAKHSPLKDVAGMVRSFHYAAYAALFQQPAHRHDRLEPIADAWQRRAVAVFLDAYRATAAAAHFLPGDLGEFHALLNLFVLEKAIYELSYELNNRPDWLVIPLCGLLSLLRPRAKPA
jgi:maltose alpha-D-glucosyltransferase/alpha-amylase